MLEFFVHKIVCIQNEMRRKKWSKIDTPPSKSVLLPFVIGATTSATIYCDTCTSSIEARRKHTHTVRKVYNLFFLVFLFLIHFFFFFGHHSSKSTWKTCKRVPFPMWSVENGIYNLFTNYFSFRWWRDRDFCICCFFNQLKIQSIKKKTNFKEGSCLIVYLYLFCICSIKHGELESVQQYRIDDEKKSIIIKPSPRRPRVDNNLLKQTILVGTHTHTGVLHPEYATQTHSGKRNFYDLQIEMISSGLSWIVGMSSFFGFS